MNKINLTADQQKIYDMVLARVEDAAKAAVAEVIGAAPVKPLDTDPTVLDQLFDEYLGKIVRAVLKVGIGLAVQVPGPAPNSPITSKPVEGTPPPGAPEPVS